jgi:AraC-like DNA-binding protein
MSLLNLSLIILFAISFFNGMFLTLKKTYSSYRNEFLGITIMIYSLFFMSYVWWYLEKFILEAPFLMRTINPLMFLAFPFFYFFVRNTLMGRKALTKWDFIHFIPALIHFAGLIPLYTMPAEDKYSLAVQMVNDPKQLEFFAQGYIPAVWVGFIRMVLQIGYYVASIRLLLGKEVKQTWGHESRKIQNWLLVSVFLIGMLLFSHLLHYIKDLLSVAGIPIPAFFEDLPYFLIIIPIMLLNVYLQINQNLIYGNTLKKLIEETKMSSSAHQSEKLNESDHPKKLVPGNMDLHELKICLEGLMREEKMYLNPDLALTDIAGRLGLNQRILSQFIKITYGVGTKEFINQYRIQDAIDLMNKGYLQDKSIQGLCQSVGFNSRVTFFLAFKKYTGVSPTDYMKQLPV